MTVTGQTRSTRNSNGTKPCSLVFFSVGGQRLAARIEDIAGVWPWKSATPVPGRTPFINALIRHGKELLPVFDLAGKLHVQVKGNAPFCLMARHERGTLAICVDEEVPSVRAVDPASIKPAHGATDDITELCEIGAEEFPIYSFKGIGTQAADVDGMRIDSPLEEA